MPSENNKLRVFARESSNVQDDELFDTESSVGNVINTTAKSNLINSALKQTSFMTVSLTEWLAKNNAGYNFQSPIKGGADSAVTEVSNIIEATIKNTTVNRSTSSDKTDSTYFTHSKWNTAHSNYKFFSSVPLNLQKGKSYQLVLSRNTSDNSGSNGDYIDLGIITIEETKTAATAVYHLTGSLIEPASLGPLVINTYYVTINALNTTWDSQVEAYNIYQVASESTPIKLTSGLEIMSGLLTIRYREIT